jgi:hypothetical protein
MNKIVPGPFVDKIITNYLGVKRKKYSTNANSALTLLAMFTDETPCGFNIIFSKQLNYQSCMVSLNRRSTDYYAEDGYLPMAICLLTINSLAKPLKYYSHEFLKLKYKTYLKAIKKENYEGFYEDFTEEEKDALNIHPDIPHMFKKLTEEQIKALVEYANR